MNDDEVLSFDENTESTKTGAADSEATPCDDSSADRGEPESGDEATEISDSAVSDPDSDPDPDPAPDHEADPGAELAELRGELGALRNELNAQRALWARLGAECEEFQTLYPDTPLSALGDAIWEDVRRGIPIAAAWALAEKKRMHTESLAKESNLANSLRSSGALESTENDFFSPAEVRAMSRDEVRENYRKIMSSMKKWH